MMNDENFIINLLCYFKFGGIVLHAKKKKNTPHSILTVYVSQLLCLTSDFLASDTTAVDSGLYSARDPTRICVKNITVWFTLY